MVEIFRRTVHRDALFHLDAPLPGDAHIRITAGFSGRIDSCGFICSAVSGRATIDEAAADQRQRHAADGAARQAVEREGAATDRRCPPLSVAYVDRALLLN